ncbi:MAG: T9SS type A sorting domain-containing protein [Marinilabiliales bacterium]
MKNLVSILIVLIVITSVSFSQPWLKNQTGFKEKGNFFEIQNAFKQYWKDKDIKKQKGWKPYKRWEDFMVSRVDSKGMIYGSILWQEYQKVKDKKSINGNWVHLGPTDTPLDINGGYKSGSGRVNCVEFHPTDTNIFWVGSPSGGLWKTTDGGNTYFTTTDDLASIGISDIAVNPVNPDIIYIATGDGDASDTYSIGILKSTDGGITWNTTGLPFNITDYVTFRRLLINPSNPDVLIASSDAGIYRTTDGGLTWTNVLSGNYKDLEFMPGNPNVVYTTLYGWSGNAAILKSTDNGASFTDITDTINVTQINRIELAVTPANPQVIYALCSKEDDNGFYAIYKSSDAGNSWAQMSNHNNINLLGWSEYGDDSGGQGWYDLSLAVSPVNENEVYAGGVNIWKSIDGGSTWTINAHWYGAGGTQYVHADQHSFEFHPVTHTLFSGNDGGLYKTDNGGNTWIDISDGLEILQVYRIGCSYTDSTIITAGCQDNGTMKKETNSWFYIMGGDGMETIVDYSNEDIIYGEYYYGNISISYDGGHTFSDIKPSLTGDGAWITPYIIHPSDPNTLYIGFTDVYKTTNRGNSWNNISNNLTGGDNLIALAIAPSDDQVIYAATYQQIWKTTNGGNTWTEITSNLPNLTIRYIAVSQFDPNHVWIALSGYDAGNKVFESIDGGNNWTNYSTGLPNLPVNCIVYQNNTNHGLYVGTDVGVYYRNASMTSWIPFMNGLPNVIVNELEIHYPTKKIRAATYGRGVWESDLYENQGVPVADFAYQIYQCSGQVNFSDISSGVPSSWYWNFGDGNTDTIQHPQHIYASLGSYDVTLIVSNSFGTDTITYTVQITGGSLNADFTADYLTFCSAPATVNFTNMTDYATGFYWDFGDGNTSTLENPQHTFDADGSYNIMLIASSLLCENDTIIKNAYIDIAPDNSVMATMQSSGYQTSECCSGVLKDNGGDNNYTSNVNSYFLIQPPNATSITINFVSFDVEPGDAGYCNYDYVAVYDGSSLASPLIGKFCNTTGNPGTITTSGGAVLIRQYSDSYVEGAGFQMNWTCLENSIDQSPETEFINLYPNPTDDVFYIEGNLKTKQDINIKIIDASAKIISNKSFKNTSGNFNLKFSLSLNPGVYYVIVNTDKKIKINKLIIN